MRGEVDLVQVHLLGQDELQEQVERAFVDGGRHIDRHRPSRTLLRPPVTVADAVAAERHERRSTAIVSVRATERQPRERPVPACVAGERHEWPAWPGNAMASVAGRDQGPFVHAADRRRPSGQLPRGAAAVGARPARQGRVPRDRRPPRPDGGRGAGRGGRTHAGAGGDVLRRRSRPRGGDGVRAEPRHRALPARLADGVQRELRRAVADGAVQGQVREARRRVHLRRPVHLPGAAGGRHPALRHRRGAGRRRPAPARRDHA